MPSQQHQEKIETIEREILNRGMDWKTKRNFPVWLHKENNWGLLDLVGFKKESSDNQNDIESAILDIYEVEEKSGGLQKKRNLEKMEQMKFLYNPSIKIFTCQITSDQNHIEICPYFNNKVSSKIECERNVDGSCKIEKENKAIKTEKKVETKWGLPKGRIGVGW